MAGQGAGIYVFRETVNRVRVAGVEDQDQENESGRQGVTPSIILQHADVLLPACVCADTRALWNRKGGADVRDATGMI